MREIEPKRVQFVEQNQQWNHRLGLLMLVGLGVILLIDRITWAACGVLLTSIRHSLNLPLLLDSLMGILNLIVIAFIQLILWMSTIHLILHRSLSEIGFGLHSKWWRELFGGFSLTTLALVVVFVIEILFGWLKIEGWVWERETFANWVLILIKSITLVTFVAVLEELIFRGFFLTGLKEAWGERIGLLLMAVIFSAVHLPMAEADRLPWPLPILVLLLISLILGYSYLRTRSLWFPIGIHFAWDFVELDVLNLIGYPDLENLVGAITYKEGPCWLVGTYFDILTGLLGVIPLSILVIGIWYWTCHFHPTENRTILSQTLDGKGV